MEELYQARLTVVGPKAAVASFTRTSGWKRAFQARHVEIYEQAPQRRTWWFQTARAAPASPLRDLSRRFAGLALLLDYESEAKREKGLAVARAGRINAAVMNY